VNTAPLIYYVPGRHETCLEHAGAVLSKAGLRYYGRDVADDFLQLTFSKQIEIIKSDIRNYMTENALLIGRSFGGYLILQAVCESAILTSTHNTHRQSLYPYAYLIVYRWFLRYVPKK